MPPRRKPASKPAAKKSAVGKSAVKKPAVKKPTGKKSQHEVAAGVHKQPIIMERVVAELTDARHKRRPSSIAKASGKRQVVEVQWADEYDAPDTWADTEDMPVESQPEDQGWMPGPAVRPLPAFNGPTPGPTDTSLTPTSTPSEFLLTQLSVDLKKKVISYTCEHCKAWRTQNPSWTTSMIECSMRDYSKVCNVRFFDLWLACKLRVAQLKPEVPAVSLWERDNTLFDAQVFASMTIHQFYWMNRHCSFAKKSSEEDEDGSDKEADDGEEDGPAEFDYHRKRRELTNLVCAQMSAAWNPHQHLGLDEAVRAHRHWGKQRIRWKAAVHSGSIVDSLNDCVTKYCMWFEEHHWVKKSDERGADDPNTVKARLLRAVSVLFDKGECMHL